VRRGGICRRQPRATPHAVTLTLCDCRLASATIFNHIRKAVCL
jgi:hypothetical protein